MEVVSCQSSRILIYNTLASNTNEKELWVAVVDQAWATSDLQLTTWLIISQAYPFQVATRGATSTCMELLDIHRATRRISHRMAQTYRTNLIEETLERFWVIIPSTIAFQIRVQASTIKTQLCLIWVETWQAFLEEKTPFISKTREVHKDSMSSISLILEPQTYNCFKTPMSWVKMESKIYCQE